MKTKIIKLVFTVFNFLRLLSLRSLSKVEASKYCLLLPVVMMSVVEPCFPQNWQWARQIGSNVVSQSDYGQVISDGTNSYLVGRTPGTIVLQTCTLSTLGFNNMFIIKFDSNGNVVWCKDFGGNNGNYDYEEAYAVYEPNCNCIYVAGRFYGNMNLGNGVSLSSSNGRHLFVAKMDLDGNFIWARSGGSYFLAGTIDVDRTYIFTEPDGDVLLAGSVKDTAVFGSYTINPGGFFARYDSDGNCKWAAQKFSGPENIKLSISFIGSDIVFSGYSVQNPTFIDTVTIYSNGSYDGFVARMDSMGKVKWLKQIGGNGLDAISGLSVDNFNNVYASGCFSDTIVIDSLTISNIGKDILITKFNQNGKLIWAKQTHAVGNSGSASSLITDNLGCYVGGSFSGNVSFGNYNLFTSNSYDMFLTRYDSSGNCLGVSNIGLASCNSLAVDNSGNVICAGGFENTINIGSNTFTSFGNWDLYLVKSDAITGLNNQKRVVENNLLTIYANPNTGKCNITIPEEFQKENNLTLQIFDLKGNQIQQVKVEMLNDKIKVSIEAEAKGIYNAVLTNEKKNYTGRIIFE